MNSLSKSIFIVIFPALALVATIDGILHLFRSEIMIQHVAHFITAASIVFFFARVFIKPLPRTDSILKAYTFLVFLGCILSFIVGNLYEKMHLMCTILNLALTFGWVLYLVWYSYFQDRDAQENSILKVEQQLPKLSFEDSNGKTVTSDLFAGTPSIFIFYRGNWCPFCMAQIKEMISKHEELTDRNINTVFVSSQPHDFTKKLTKKHSLDFQFLVDVDGKVAKELAIFAKNGLPFGFQVFGFKKDVVLPTVIITDSKEKIIYINQADNYRVRPEPAELLKVIDANI
ncbi:redoxin domain-containing protein [uncultured Kordia sp.]|uniref:peroxiredoxin family protein n=1 Tax=uncultured Kordia sp. TaxID=507699 RepID=UPI00260479CD|nr:redoxin domain-containing protein [uncultured Kordia sp.]